MKNSLWLLPIFLIATVLIYLPGLSGPFLFDDAPHIVKNVQVHITDLSPDSLSQAWHSSLATGVGSRPLSQLTFGINHALGGMDARGFKTVNLLVHLLVGLMIFVFSRELGRCMARNNASGPSTAPSTVTWVALLTAGIWLLHPLNLTPVLYVVQRMTSLSALFVIAALWCHVRGRRAMADGNPAGFWLALAGWPLAILGGLAKESAALYPAFVLVLEWTLLRSLAAPRRRLLIGLTAALPLAIGALYLLTHLGLLNHAGRDFTLIERVMTESRVLWLYLQMLVWPDLSVLGFYHDDVAVSRSLTTPWTTLPAIAAWVVVIAAAIIGGKRRPVVSFGVLFFVAGHLLESTLIPLELVFEHRNYVPILGPIFAVTWLAASHLPERYRRLALLAAVVALSGLAMLTHLRAMDWADETRLTFQEVAHHPGSQRANFRAAQIYIGEIQRGNVSRENLEAALAHLAAVQRLSPSNLNAHFGQLFLMLIVNRDPPAALISELATKLRSEKLDPTKLSLGQLSYLVKWQLSNGHHLAHKDALALLTAAADNPRQNNQSRAAAFSALRAYYDRVLNDPARALPFAEAAVRTWPHRWHYHYRLVEALLRLNRVEDARNAFQRAVKTPSAALNKAQVAQLAERLHLADPFSQD